MDSLDYQRQIIDIFLNSIRVFDDRIVVTYNYKDGTETISLADIEAALGSDSAGECPPHLKRSRTLADDVKLVGEGFGYVVWADYVITR